MTNYRIEKDSLGELKVPNDAWYGIQTARGIDNFQISGRKPDPDFVHAHVTIKRAAAVANKQPNWLDDKQSQAIIDACEQILAGEHLDQFVIDRFQAGAGTSHNMNSNEVIANLANVALGGDQVVDDRAGQRRSVGGGAAGAEVAAEAVEGGAEVVERGGHRRLQEGREEERIRSRSPSRPRRSRP